MGRNGKVEMGFGSMEGNCGSMETVFSETDWKESVLKMNTDKLTDIRDWLPEDCPPDAHPAVVLPCRGTGNAQPISNAKLVNQKLTESQNCDCNILDHKLTDKSIDDLKFKTLGTGCHMYSALSPGTPFTDASLRVNRCGSRGADGARVVNRIFRNTLTDFDCFNVQEYFRSSPVRTPGFTPRRGVENPTLWNYFL